MVRVGTRLAAVEMIQSGTTAYADMYYFEEEIARATKAAGLRGVLGQTLIDFPVADAKTFDEGLARAEAFIKEFAADDLIVPAVAPHAPYTVSGDHLKAARALATKYGVPYIIHVAETSTEVSDSQKAHGGLTPGGVPRFTRRARTSHAGRARGLGHAGGHRDSEEPARWRCPTIPKAT